MSVFIDFSKEKLPPVYKRKGKECYLDPVRERLIMITPEETVRQEVISYVLNTMKAPTNMVKIEDHMSHYGVVSKRRVDISILKYNAETNELNPLCIIECKAPEVMLDDKAISQMMDYCDLLCCNYGMVTNGQDTICYHYDEKTESYEVIESLPEYLDMLKGVFVNEPESERPPRLEYCELDKEYDAYVGSEMGSDTKKEFLPALVNFWECLIYDEHKFPEGNHGLFSVKKDLGGRLSTYGNAGGGKFPGYYRSFLIEYNGSTEIVGIGISSYYSFSNTQVLKTAICVSIDNEKVSHHSLQLCVDDNMTIRENVLTFYHSGRIAVGNIGSGKIDELRMFISDKYPKIIDGKRFNLGTLVNDHLWNLDEPDVIEVIDNLISYSLIRDDYRDYLQNVSK